MVALALPLGCGEDDTETTGQRGMPGRKKGKDGKGPAQRGGAAPAAAVAGGDGSGFLDEPVDEGVKREPPKLDQTSFVRRRDPFQGFVAPELTLPEPDPIRADRKVELRQYAFEDLRLVAIANTRRAKNPPRALFVASDGHSGSVVQGQHYSTAEVLLVAVNRDYVEIEVVDEELAASLGMKRGERRALYLNNE